MIVIAKYRNAEGRRDTQASRAYGNVQSDSQGYLNLPTTEKSGRRTLNPKAAELMKADPNSLELRVNGSRITQAPNDPIYRIKGLE